jgi:ABC-type transporter Mla subunit MlaD
MPLQDLTPQLRTRLSRMERAVGWFVILATVLLFVGFGYYLYNIAERKGWFIKKVSYQTSISSGAGLKVGDSVKLMGFDAGEITAIIPNDPYDSYNITVNFRIKAPHFGYLWSDSKVKVVADGFLGNRYLEVIKGVEGVPTVDETNKVAVGVLKKNIRDQFEALTSQGLSVSNAWQQLNEQAKHNKSLFYTNLTKNTEPYWLDPIDSPAVTERLEKLVGQVEEALPNILRLTNQLATVLSNSANLTSNLNTVATDVRPAISNLAALLSQLDKPGALGDWLIPTNINQKLDSVLGGADTVMTIANTNLLTLNETLLHLSDLTSNLNNQVQVNSNILSQVSKAVTNADDFVQGLKHHWLLRSAFKKESSTARSRKPVEPMKSPKATIPPR